jgi:uncharacterized Zn-finger protein
LTNGSIPTKGQYKGKVVQTHGPTPDIVCLPLDTPLPTPETLHVFCNRSRVMPAIRASISLRRTTTPVSSRDISLETTSNAHTCHLCNGQYSRKYGLLRHMRDVHQENKYVCCVAVSALSNLLPIRPYQCEFPGCGKRFSQNSNKNVHYTTQ